jgi:hypothetical protein
MFYKSLKRLIFDFFMRRRDPCSRDTEMGQIASMIQIVAAVLGVWAVVSVGSTLVLIPVFRARARANARLTRQSRRDDWLVAASLAEQGELASR